MSANASKGKILSLDEYRKEQLRRAAAPPAFDPQAVRQRIVRAQAAPSAEERELALQLVLHDADEMLRLLAVMGGEIIAFRQQVKSIVQQSSDTSVVLAAILERQGGTYEVPLDWFTEWEPATGSGFMVNEEPERNAVVIRAIVVDATTTDGVGSMSASGQTGEGE